MPKFSWSRLLIPMSLIMLLGPARAQRPDLITPLVVDLDGDGKVEVVAIRPFVQDGVELGQLVVRDEAGKTIWEGPSHSASPSYPQEPDIFLGEFDLGDLEAVGDFNGDGKIELMGTYQKSDVRPTRFRLFELDGKAFVHRRSGSLLPAPQRPATFVWAENAGAKSWIESFHGFDQGRFQATLNDLSAGTSSEVELASQDGGDGLVLVIPQVGPGNL